MKTTLILLTIILLSATAFSRRCGPKKPASKPCYVGGCSSQLCTADQGALSTCEWREEYACYRDATCERQADGQCGWTSTPELEQCLQGTPIDPVPGPCYAGGCSGQLCTDEIDIISTCEWNEEYACYREATCERQADGQCGWTSTPELDQCLQGTPIDPVPGPCYAGGCSGQLCTDQIDAISTCEWTPAYDCYKGATCERQNDGQCGWTSTPELEQCLENPGPIVLPPIKACYVGGCSGQVCSSEKGAISTCEWREEYGCYALTNCEIQNDGQCGWTRTPEFEQCWANGGSSSV